MLTLIIGNKNYSSWSMRPWVLMRELGIPFAEHLLKFHSAQWAASIATLSPTRMVPVLWDGEPTAADAIAIWETVAIFEYLAERFPDRHVWPRDAAARAMARAIVAEMHAGFRALRMAMPMNIRASHPGKGMNEDVTRNIERIESLWRAARQRFGASGPFLFGAFSAADAMYAPVAMRFMTYAPPLAADTTAYCTALRESRGVAEWMAGARLENEFVEEDEPYAAKP